MSTATALLQEIHEGAMRVGALQQRDLGLGACEHLDGDMVIVDGHCFQVRCDGVVRECDKDVISPCAVVTRFTPDETITLDKCADLAQLTSRFDSLRTSDTVSFALRVEGSFEYVQTRAMCRTANRVQPEFKLHNVCGTLVGFWTPSYATTLNMSAYHLHFISDDRESGGHLLQCRGTNLRLQIQRTKYH
jgi:acetolactate decarboxylase